MATNEHGQVEVAHTATVEGVEYKYLLIFYCEPGTTPACVGIMRRPTAEPDAVPESVGEEVFGDGFGWGVFNTLREEARQKADAP